MAERFDVIDQRQARAVAALLDLPTDELVAGAPLPSMWHLFYFLTFPAQADIGHDGHPSVGESTPAGTRRMFAGGRVRLRPGLRIGQSVSAQTDVVSDTTREGSSGLLRFVTHRTEMRPLDADGSGAVALVDERDVVYIPLAPGARSSDAVESEPEGVDPEAVPADALAADAYRSVTVDPMLLFRFSALTHNAHRIHYDRDYTVGVEGYPGLVVHGPLQAVLMADLVTREAGLDDPLEEFRYRLVAPLFEGQGLFVTCTRQEDGLHATVMDRSGRVTAKGVLGAVRDDVG